MPNALSTELFIKRSIKTHGLKYDYSESIYINCRTKIAIICKTHGRFNQNPKAHMDGQGCPRCGKTGKLKLSDFLEKSRSIHGDTYDYSICNYVSSKIYVDIICKKHGVFSQKPSEHMRGYGCLKCSWDRSGCSRAKFIKACRKSNGLGYLYLIKCSSEKESFYKIGITSGKIRKRMCRIPYHVDVLSLIKSDSNNVFSEEKRLLKSIKNIKYTPNVFFLGRTECFSELTKEIKEYFGVQY